MLRRTLCLLVAVLCLTLSLGAHAQGHGGGMGGPPGGGMGHGGMGAGGFGERASAPDGEGASAMRGSRALQTRLAPAGRWWDDDRFTRLLRIDPMQRKRMDDVFNSNRSSLMGSYKNLQREETELAKLMRAKDLDEGQIFGQIDRVSQARGEVEKAYAHLQLELRKTMTTDQTSRLDELRFNAPDGAASQ